MSEDQLPTKAGWYRARWNGLDVCIHVSTDLRGEHFFFEWGGGSHDVIAWKEIEWGENIDDALAQRDGLLDDVKLLRIPAAQYARAREEGYQRFEREQAGLRDEIDRLLAFVPKCAHCQAPATCYGAYDGAVRGDFACDDCCGHGCEDGRCVRIDAESLRAEFERSLEQVVRLASDLGSITSALLAVGAKPDASGVLDLAEDRAKYYTNMMTLNDAIDSVNKTDADLRKRITDAIAYTDCIDNDDQMVRGSVEHLRTILKGPPA